jgi:hypothetical protein
MGLRRFFGSKTKRKAADLEALAALREKLRPAFLDQRCLVLGSAPQFQLAHHDRCICVNGSGWSANKLGIEIPHLTVLSGWTLRGKTAVQNATIEALNGLKTQTALMVDIGLSPDSAKKVLRGANYQFEQLFMVSPDERATIFSEVCGMPLPEGDHNSRPSNGLFAVALVLWSGAKHVSISGFSLSGGHSYMTGNTPRHHVEGDKWFLAQTKDLPIEIV